MKLRHLSSVQYCFVKFPDIVFQHKKFPKPVLLLISVEFSHLIFAQTSQRIIGKILKSWSCYPDAEDN